LDGTQQSIPSCCFQDEEFARNLSGDHKARVAAFVADLLADDEDEAEIPMRAMRRPVVFATAVESELHRLFGVVPLSRQRVEEQSEYVLPDKI